VRKHAPDSLKQHFLAISSAHKDADGRICIEMELCEDMDLHARLCSVRKVRHTVGSSNLGYPVEAVQGIMWQVLRIIEVLEALGVRHRDIKLENLLVKLQSAGDREKWTCELAAASKAPAAAGTKGNGTGIGHSAAGGGS